MKPEEEEAFENWDIHRLKSISNIIVEYFPSVMIFHTLIVGMTAVRSPTDFAVSITLMAMLMRIVMVFGYYTDKKAIYIASSGVEMLINFFLLFICMGYK